MASESRPSPHGRDRCVHVRAPPCLASAGGECSQIRSSARVQDARLCARSAQIYVSTPHLRLSHSAHVRLQASAWDAVKPTLKVGFICPVVVSDPTVLGATIVVAQALCLTIFTHPRRRKPAFLPMVIKLVCVCRFPRREAKPVSIPYPGLKPVSGRDRR